MTASWKTALLAGAALTVFGGVAFAQEAPASSPAQTAEEAAQQNEPLSPQDLSDPVTEATQETGDVLTDEVSAVVVTARRREESLQDVPIAVTAVSGARLEAIGAENITALQQQTPNLTLQVARGSNSTLIAFIRGVGQQDPLWGFEPGVGLYIDDVYVARPQGAVLDIFDVQRVEVLRGPQGTLYGRNTIGGAVKYVTGRIGGQPQAKLRATVGSYNQRDLVVSASAPLGDMFAVGGAFATYNRDGYGSNLTTGAEHYNKDVWAGRGTLEFTPSSSLFFRLSYDRVQDDSNARHGHRETTLVGAAGTPIFTGASAAIGQSPGSVYDTYAGLGDANSVETEGVSLLAQWELSEHATFKSITAGRRGDTRTHIDFDGTPANVLDVPAFYTDEQFSQEFQLLLEGDQAQGVIGLYYMNSSAAGAFDTIAGLLGLNIVSAGKINTHSVAAFADFSVDLTERASLSIGARWTEDKKDGAVFRAFYLGTGRSPFNGGPPRAPLLVRTNYQPSGGFEEITPRFSLRYEFSEDLTGYASYSRGFKSGGWDMRGDAVATPNTVGGYDPETVDAFEVGLKGSLFDRRVNFQSALFKSKYEDQQVTTQVPFGTTIASFVDNVGNSSIWGAELEGNARVTDNLSFQFALGYIDAQFDEFVRFNLATRLDEDISDLVVFQNTPQWTGFAGLTYTHELPGLGRLTFIPSASYRSDYSMFEFPNPILDQDAFWLVDASVVWDINDRYSVSLNGRNLTDEEYRVGAYNFAYGTSVAAGQSLTFGNSLIGFYGPPRTWTLTLGVKF